VSVELAKTALDIIVIVLDSFGPTAESSQLVKLYCDFSLLQHLFSVALSSAHHKTSDCNKSLLSSTHCS